MIHSLLARNYKIHFYICDNLPSLFLCTLTQEQQLTYHLKASLLRFTAHPSPRNVVMRDDSIGRSYLHTKKSAILQLDVTRSQSLTSNEKLKLGSLEKLHGAETLNYIGIKFARP